MLKQFSTYFWFCLLVFIINQGVEKYSIYIPYVHSYLDDVLCPGIVLGFTLWFQQRFTYKNFNYVFNFKLLILFVGWYSFLFEVWFPYHDPRHHADPWDILAYAAGTFLYAFLGNKSILHLKESVSLTDQNSQHI